MDNCIHTGLYSNTAFKMLDAISTRVFDYTGPASYYYVVNKAADNEIVIYSKGSKVLPRAKVMKFYAKALREYCNDNSIILNNSSTKVKIFKQSFLRCNLLYLYAFMNDSKRVLNMLPSSLANSVIGKPLDPVKTELNKLLAEETDKLKAEYDSIFNKLRAEQDNEEERIENERDDKLNEMNARYDKIYDNLENEKKAKMEELVKSIKAA